jgi:basic amino acid/polyamine antiporter, APA family
VATGQTETDLRRGIGFWGLLAFSVGINIGAGLFILLNIGATFAGPALPIAMIVAAVPALLALVPYRVLATGYPTTAGTYRYAKLLDPSVAFVTLASVVVAILVGGQPLFALVAGEYIAGVAAVNPVAVGAIALVFFYIVNLYGVRPTVVIQTALMVSLMAALALFIVAGMPAVDPTNFRPFFAEGPEGALIAGGILYALLAGGLFIVDVGDEVIEPARLYRSVLPLGMVVVLAIYLLMIVVVIGTVPYTELEDETLFLVARQFMGDGTLAFFALGGAVVAGLTTLNVTYVNVSRAVMVAARDGLLPEFLGRVSRYGTPHWALTVSMGISLVVLLLQPPTAFLGSMLNLGLVVAITVVVSAALRVPTRHPHIYEPSRASLSVGTLRAACIAVVVLNALTLLLLTAGTPLATLTLLGLMGAAFLYRTLVTRVGPADRDRRGSRT